MVTVIIPILNEKKIVRCLVSLRDQTYKDVEIIKVEGKFTPIALNEGIRRAKGDIIIRCDAHAWYPPDYIERCVYWLNKTGADNVGGNCITVADKNTNMARVIAKAMSFGGLFRRNTDKMSETDTVWGGCYRRDLFNKIGYFDERLKRCQDIEFNMRLKKAGGKIILHPSINSFYFPKSTFLEFIKHSFIDGMWTTYIFKYGIILKWRHYFSLCFVLLVMGLVLFLEFYAYY